MGVRITADEDVVALFDSVSGFAFGPTFPSSDDAQDFLDYLQSLGEDGRELDDAVMGLRYDTWRERQQQDEDRQPFDMSGATPGVER